jgi:hypothetical protein
MRKTALAFVVVALLACSASAAYTIDKPIYSKLILFQDVVIYAQAEGDAIRFATTPEGLKDAPPIKGIFEKEYIHFKNVSIPIAPESIPEGFAGVGGNFSFHPKRIKGADGRYQTVPCTHATVWLSKLDQQNVKWDYVFSAGKDMLPELDKAPENKADLSKGLTLDITAAYRTPSAAIGVKVKSGDLTLENVLRDGKPAPVTVTVTDSAGKQIESKEGRLIDFGFG